MKEDMVEFGRRELDRLASTSQEASLPAQSTTALESQAQVSRWPHSRGPSPNGLHPRVKSRAVARQVHQPHAPDPASAPYSRTASPRCAVRVVPDDLQ